MRVRSLHEASRCVMKKKRRLSWWRIQCLCIAYLRITLPHALKKQRCIFVQYARFSLQIRQKQNEHQTPSVHWWIYILRYHHKEVFFCLSAISFVNAARVNSSRLLLLETLHHNSLGLFWTKTYWLVWSQDAFLVLFTVLNIETSSTPSSLGHSALLSLYMLI